MNVIRGKSE